MDRGQTTFHHALLFRFPYSSFVPSKILLLLNQETVFSPSQIQTIVIVPASPQWMLVAISFPGHNMFGLQPVVVGHIHPSLIHRIVGEFAGEFAESPQLPRVTASSSAHSPTFDGVGWIASGMLLTICFSFHFARFTSSGIFIPWVPVALRRTTRRPAGTLHGRGRSRQPIPGRSKTVFYLYNPPLAVPGEKKNPCLVAQTANAVPRLSVAREGIQSNQ